MTACRTGLPPLLAGAGSPQLSPLIWRRCTRPAQRWRTQASSWSLGGAAALTYCLIKCPHLSCLLTPGLGSAVCAGTACPAALFCCWPAAALQGSAVASGTGVSARGPRIAAEPCRSADAPACNAASGPGRPGAEESTGPLSGDAHEAPTALPACGQAPPRQANRPVALYTPTPHLEHYRQWGWQTGTTPRRTLLRLAPAGLNLL